MNINVQNMSSPFFSAASLLSHRGLKSTEEKMERQAKRDNQISFYENQKENLKKMECTTVEEIARKLDMFHSYEDQIAAVKAAYNSEQMWHILDESREIGEKIAEAAEKLEPKTPEERIEEIVEEAMGTDENEGVLEEVMDEAAKMQEEIQEEIQEELQGELQEKIEEGLQEQLTGEITETTENIDTENLAESLQEAENVTEIEKMEEIATETAKKKILSEELYGAGEKDENAFSYQPIDIRL